jgi:glycosyltransferase involved in cell wall biosynthesis
VKLGLVVPRYGGEVLGGTEHWLRLLCEHLVADRDWAVEVFTTCARSAATWADDYPPGTLELNGVRVHRYRSDSGRNPAYLHQLDRLRREAATFSTDEAMAYVRLVGPVCPQATTAAVGSDCDLVAVTPYLYWPTLTAVAGLGRRVIFHGATHDEPELYLPVMGPMFGAVGGFAYNSFAERSLVEGRFPVGHLPSSVIGNAVDEGSGDRAAARRSLGLTAGERFVLCLGRVERSKGSASLAAMWELYRSRRPDAPTLVLLGPVNDDVAAGPGVVVAGPCSEAVKWGALAACELLVAPSAQESFSLVVLEAWLAGRPVVVNGRCGPTVEHCRRSGGGVWYDGYGEFEVAVDLLLADPARGAALAARGAAYTRRTFAWPAILDRYEELAARILARLSAPAGTTAAGPGRPAPDR